MEQLTVGGGVADRTRHAAARNQERAQEKDAPSQQQNQSDRNRNRDRAPAGFSARGHFTPAAAAAVETNTGGSIAGRSVNRSVAHATIVQAAVGSAAIAAARVGLMRALLRDGA